MDVESRTARLEVLFDAALDLSDDERERFLSGPCVEAELREDLAALLTAARSDSPLDKSPVHLGGLLTGIEVMPGLAIDQRVGRYRLVRMLGEGGMASVWLAEREAGDFQHQVALKCLKTGMLTEDSRSRFLREQHILAQLRHLYIGRLFDAGISDEGIPFLVMEYIDGQPLLQHCHEHRLGLRNRLELFRKICSAVAYAHQNLVVHRDIKPSNIMVDSRGEPRLLDFGIAKLLNAGDDPITRTGLRVLTPEYAAPEQLNDQAITTATDVYGLGTVLYELLTGVRARAGLGARLDSGYRPVPRPSETLKSAVKTTGVGYAELRGDLDIIVLTALQEEPARRYPSAHALGEDIERYLTQQPILARKDTVAYRVRKFVRRHRVGVGASAVAAATLVVASAVSIHQAMIAKDEALRATAESVRADKERQRAVAARDFLIGLFQVTENSGQAHDKLPTADKLLEEGAKRILSEFDDAPELKLDLMLTLARMQFKYGNNDSAEQLVKESLAISDAVLSPKDEQWLETRRGWAAILMRKPGNSAEAIELLSDSIRRHREAGAEDNKALVGALGALGFAYLNADRRDEAVAAAREGVEVARRSSGTSPKRVQQALGRYLELLIATRHWNSAAAAVDENLKLAEQIYGKWHPDYANAAALKAEFLARWLHRYDEAEKISREAVVILETIYDKPTVELNFALSVLGDTLLRRGKFDEAEDVFKRLLQLGKQLAGPKSGYVSVSLYGLAEVVEKRGDLAGAEKLYRQAFDTREDHGSQQSKIADIQDGLARVLHKQGRDAEAERMLRDGIQLASKLRGPTSPHVAMLTSSLAMILAGRGRTREADALIAQSLSSFEQDPNADSGDLVETKIIKCDILNIENNFANAAALAASVIATLNSPELGNAPDFDQLALAWKQLGIAQQALGQPKEAMASFNNAKSSMEKALYFDKAEAKSIETRLAQLGRSLRTDQTATPLPGR